MDRSDAQLDRRSRTFGRASAITAVAITLLAPTSALIAFFATYDVPTSGLHLLLVSWVVIVIATWVTSIVAIVLGAIAVRRPPGRVTGVLGVLLAAVDVLWPVIAGVLLYLVAGT